MAEGIGLVYGSRLARHQHVCWCAEQPDEPLAIPAFDPDLVERLPVACFNHDLVALRLGRFYPSRLLARPDPPGARFRVIALNGDVFVADFNHPLASHAVATQREQLPGAAVGRAALLFQWAGMEVPLADADTGFDDPGAWEREDPDDDSIFYTQPRRVLHVDQACAARIAAFYAAALAPGARVLDLMAGWRSHLPRGLGSTVGLGMNGEEMADNSELDAALVHDLNRNPTLPFVDRCFDAVVNTVSFEYLIQPERILPEVYRVLRPGGVFAVVFSNRYFPPKAIRLWTRLHSMECLGCVLQQLHHAGFTDLQTRVEQGLQRPAEDRYADRLKEMDPLFGVWGGK